MKKCENPLEAPHPLVARSPPAGAGAGRAPAAAPGRRSAGPFETVVHSQRWRLGSEDMERNTFPLFFLGARILD